MSTPFFKHIPFKEANNIDWLNVIQMHANNLILPLYLNDITRTLNKNVADGKYLDVYVEGMLRELGVPGEMNNTNWNNEPYADTLMAEYRANHGGKSSKGDYIMNHCSSMGLTGNIIENLGPLDRDGKYLVIDDISFLIALAVKCGIPKKNITMITTDDDFNERLYDNENSVLAKFLSNIDNHFIESTKDSIITTLRDKNMKFDAIIGNPPYENQFATNIAVELHKNCLNEGGKIAMITPRTVTGVTTLSKMKKIEDFNMLYIDASDEVINSFGQASGNNACYWIAEKSQPKGITTLITPEGEESNISLDLRSSINLALVGTDTIYQSFYNATEKLGIDTIGHFHSSKTEEFNKTRTDYHCYPIIKGLNHLWCSRKSKNYYDMKVMFGKSNGDYFYGENIGTEEHTMVATVSSKSEADQVIRIVGFKLTRYWLEMHKSGPDMGTRAWRQVPKSSAQTDEEFYKEFNLTKKDIKIIEDWYKTQRPLKRRTDTEEKLKAEWPEFKTL